MANASAGPATAIECQRRSGIFSLRLGSQIVGCQIRYGGDPVIKYLTTDPQVLGILSWASVAITVLGFAFAIWQILRVKRAADAAREAAVGLALRVRSRELLAKLGDVHIHLKAARNHATSGERQIVILCLELACGCAIEAQEISRGLSRSDGDLERLTVLLGQLTEQVARMPDPLPGNADFIQLRSRLGSASQLLQRHIAQSRYTYEVPEV